MLRINILYLGASFYGLWVTIASISQWANIGDLGIGNGLRNELTKAIANGDFTRQKSLIKTAIIMLSRISIFLFFILTLVSEALIMLNILDWTLRIPLYITNGFFCLSFILGIARTIAYSYQKSWFASLAQTSTTAFQILGVLLLLLLSIQPNLVIFAIFSGVASILGNLVIEYIIIDGGSTDGTVDIIRKYADRIAYWVSEPDKGIYDAMNKDTKKANGEYIAFLNSDDWYELDAVSIIAQFADGKNDLISGIIKLYKNDLFLYAHGSSMDNIYNEMIAHPSTFMKRDLFWELGGYDLSYKYVADYDLMLRLKKHGGHFVFVDKVIANFRLEGASSDVNSLLEKNILKRIYCKRSFWKYWLCRYFIRIYVAAL